MPDIFSPEINWLNQLIEEHEYETTITETFDGTEQRQSLMNVPHRRLSYTVLALDEREAGRLEGLIRKVQGEDCYVPYWRGTRYLKQAPEFSPGAKTRLYINSPSSAGFEVGNWAMLFVDAHQAIVSQIYSILADGLLVELIDGVWPIGRTKVVPAFLGQLSPEIDVDYAAKFAKSVPVTFDLHPNVREISADCSWQFVESVLNPFGAKWSIDPTGGPTGGPALMVTIPPNSRDVHLSIDNPSALVKVIGLPISDSIITHVFTLEAKVKTDWDIAAVSEFDGRPGIGLAPPGVGFDAATSAAFNAWEQLSDFTDTSTGDEVTIRLSVSQGTSEPVAHHAWFADVVLKDSEGNVIHSCLPTIGSADPAGTPIFAPLDALHRPGASLQKVRRKVEQLTSPAGVFSSRVRALDPLTDHVLSLVFFSDEQWFAFRVFHDLVLGAFGAFWVPSYQQDLTPVGVIAADAVDIDIKDVGYTAQDFPSLNRRQVAFVQPDGSFVKRSILSSVNNGDGTETITINEELGFPFAQNNANGICFLWYCRFMDDNARTEWITDRQATMEIAVTELRDPPDGGSGSSVDGFLLDAP